MPGDVERALLLPRLQQLLAFLEHVLRLIQLDFVCLCVLHLLGAVEADAAEGLRSQQEGLLLNNNYKNITSKN